MGKKNNVRKKAETRQLFTSPCMQGRLRAHSDLLHEQRNTTIDLPTINNACLPPYYEHVSSSWIHGLYHIQGPDRIRIITMLNRKLLEKQRVQNHFASYEVNIGHFFYNIYATVSFGNRLTLSIFNFSPDWQTDKTNCLTPFAMRTYSTPSVTKIKGLYRHIISLFRAEINSGPE